MTRRRLLEWGKNLLIVLLTCSALLLTVMASMDDRSGASLRSRVSAWFGGGAAEDESSAADRATAAALPVEISMSTAAGRTSALYDAAALSEAYERFGGLLGQALEASDEAERCTMDEVCAALARPGVYFCYPGALPLPVLARWLDADCGGDAQGQWFALSAAGDGTVRLLFGTDEAAFACPTYLQADRLERELDRFRPDGTLFAFESADYATLDPLTLLDPDGVYHVPELEAASVWSESFVTATATAMGFNPYGEGYYTETDGTVVFTETGCTLRLGTDGGVLLSSQLSGDARFTAADESLASQIEAARALLARLTQGQTGEAALYLSEIAADDAATTLRFEYYLAGVRIQLTDGPAAEVTLAHGAVTQLRVRVRAYASLPEAGLLLPPRQAAALVTDGRLRVGYVDTGDSTPGVGWTS